MNRRTLAATAAAVLLGGPTLTTPAAHADTSTATCKASVAYGKTTSMTATTKVVKSAKRVAHKKRTHRYRATVWVTVRGASTGHQTITVTSCDAQGVPHATRYPATAKATATKRVKATVTKPHRAAAIRVAKAKAANRARTLVRPAARSKALSLVSSSKASRTSKAQARNAFVVGQEGQAERAFVSLLNAKRTAAGLGSVTWATEVEGLTAPAAREFVLTSISPHPGPSDLPSASECDEVYGVGAVVVDGYTTPLTGDTSRNAKAAATGALSTLLGSSATKTAVMSAAATRVAVSVWTRPDASGNQSGAMVVELLDGTCPEMP